MSIDRAAAELAPASVDVIVSNDVLEEIYDLDATFAALDRVLKPGGRRYSRDTEDPARGVSAADK